jgi:hypothetical protein
MTQLTLADRLLLLEQQVTVLETRLLLAETRRHAPERVIENRGPTQYPPVNHRRAAAELAAHRSKPLPKRPDAPITMEASHHQGKIGTSTPAAPNAGDAHVANQRPDRPLVVDLRGGNA